jgi:hypothetical protein
VLLTAAACAADSAAVGWSSIAYSCTTDAWRRLRSPLALPAWSAAASTASRWRRLLSALTAAAAAAPYCDAKVANRDTTIWHFVRENGY